MKKKFMFGFFLFSCVVNGALTREEARRITEGAVVNMLARDVEEIRTNGLGNVALYIGQVLRNQNVRSFTQENFSNFLTEYFNTGDGERNITFLRTVERENLISSVIGSNTGPSRFEDFLEYMMPVRTEFRNHTPRESFFCVGNYGLFFANLYANNYNMDEESDANFQSMLTYIRERPQTYRNHSVISASLQSAPLHLRIENSSRNSSI